MGLNTLVCAQATWQSLGHRIIVHKSALIDLVDSNPPDSDQKHVLNSEPSITLVKSDGCGLILQLTNRGVTCGCMWTLQ